MKTVFLDKNSLDQSDLDFTRLLENNEWDLYANTVSSDTAKRTSLAEIIISNKVIIDKNIIDNSPNLKLICVAATGTNNVDLVYAREKGIIVCNVRAYGTNSVAQHVFTTLLMLVRSIPQYQKAIKRGDWPKSKEFCLLDYPLEDLNGKTFGIIGYGELGKGVAKLARAFGMDVLIAARDKSEITGNVVSMEKLLQRTDVLSLHCPLTMETKNLISESELKIMKKSSYLINMARGGIVNEEYLAHALLNKEIAGAAVDVLVTEPPTNDSVLLKLDLPNLIITPHIAWASKTARQNILNQITENIETYTQGKALTNQMV